MLELANGAESSNTVMRKGTYNQSKYLVWSRQYRAEYNLYSRVEIIERQPIG